MTSFYIVRCHNGWQRLASKAGNVSTVARPLYVIANDIRKDWATMPVQAKPYWQAMTTLTRITDRYYADDAESVVRYFLSNATHWRGPVAKAIKAELREMLP